MKSERRHELQTNYLASHLGTAVETGRPYGVYIAAGVAAVALLAIAYGIYATQAAKANALAWGDYYFNIGTGNAEVFQQVAQDHPRTPAAKWAMQAWADNQLMQGLNEIYSNRKKAEITIEGAIDAYQEVLQSSYEPELKNRAAMGLAQAYEAIGKLDEATRYYQQVAGGDQDGLAAMAAQRSAWIKSGEAKTFYDWFASVRSTPAPPPVIPGDLSQPPTVPDMPFPQKQNPLTLPNAGTTPPVSDLPNAPASTPPASQSPEGAGPPSSLQLNPATPPAPTQTNPQPSGDKPTSQEPATSAEPTSAEPSDGVKAP